MKFSATLTYRKVHLPDFRSHQIRTREACAEDVAGTSGPVVVISVRMCSWYQRQSWARTAHVPISSALEQTFEGWSHMVSQRLALHLQAGEVSVARQQFAVCI